MNRTNTLKNIFQKNALFFQRNDFIPKKSVIFATEILKWRFRHISSLRIRIFRRKCLEPIGDTRRKAGSLIKHKGFLIPRRRITGPRFYFKRFLVYLQLTQKR